MLPTKLLQSPITDTTIEIRFSSDYPADAVFGIIYKNIQRDFSKPKKMPILELPDEVRSNDPSLLFQPYYRLLNNDYILQIGPRMVSLSPKTYPGWTTFHHYTTDIFENILSAQVAVKIERIGLRFINSFTNQNILSDLNISLQILGKPHNDSATYIRTIIEEERFASTLQIASNANFTKENKSVKGSIIDIDTYLTSLVDANIEAIKEPINDAHSIAKNLFFGLLSDQLLQKLEPVYDQS